MAGCTALVCSPADADRIWIGAAGGGVWASSDAGRNWAFRWRAKGPLQIGALAIDPSHPDRLYCGNVSPRFKQADNRGIWMVYITIDPNDADTVYTGNQRVYRTRNDGVSWNALSPVLDGSPISAKPGRAVAGIALRAQELTGTTACR